MEHSKILIILPHNPLVAGSSPARPTNRYAPFERLARFVLWLAGHLVKTILQHLTWDMTFLRYVATYIKETLAQHISECQSQRVDKNTPHISRSRT